MGLNCTALSFKGVRQDQVASAIQATLPGHDCFVSPCMNGWVTVVDRECDFGTTQVVAETAGAICRACGCPGIALGVLSSDYLCYWIFNTRGELIDFSCPQDLETASEEEERGLAGVPERIADICQAGVTGNDVRVTLSEDFPLKDSNLYNLGGLMGINPGHLTLSYRYIARNSDQWHQQHVESWRDFIHICHGHARPAG